MLDDLSVLESVVMGSANSSMAYWIIYGTFTFNSISDTRSIDLVWEFSEQWERYEFWELLFLSYY